MSAMNAEGLCAPSCLDGESGGVDPFTYLLIFVNVGHQSGEYHSDEAAFILKWKLRSSSRPIGQGSSTGRDSLLTVFLQVNEKQRSVRWTT